MADVGKPAFIQNIALNSKINKDRQSQIYLDKTFVIEGATCFSLFTNTIVTDRPLFVGLPTHHNVASYPKI
jgi:hypothetical protein